MRAVAGPVVRFGREHKTGLYYAACVFLLVAATGLRFHDLAEKSLRHDEAVAANISRGGLSEVVRGTRCCSSSPILYPLAAYVVQKVESTPFSIRVVPATASVLTIAVMLFLLPRLGVARRAAFLAALLATLSVAAIRHAQDAREYSVDALVALLIVVGLLRQLRDGKTALLCASLFIAPLVQYGLPLFGVAVIATAAVFPRVSGWQRRGAYLGRTGDWLKQRLDLLAPSGFLLAGSVVSYLATLRYHGTGFGAAGHLSEYYFRGEFDVLSIFAFSIDGVWELLKYHLPEIVAIAALPAGILLAFRRKLLGAHQDRAILVLFSFCIAVSVVAVILGMYPLGGIRQVVYLGPIVFLAVGISFQRMAEWLSSLTTRAAWAMPILLVMTGGTALAGVNNVLQNSPYKALENVESVLDVLEDQFAEEDMVYAGWGPVPAIRFYQGKAERPANHYYGTAWCTSFAKQCLREMAELAYWLGAANGRIWFVTYQLPEKLKRHLPGLSVRHLVSDGSVHLYLIEDAESLIKIATATGLLTKSPLPRKPPIRSTFDVYLGEAKVVYVKTPCGAKDVQEAFFLHVYPAHASDLPQNRRERGFENLDFSFNGSGVRTSERCVALRDLPDYEITGIRTGQYTDEGRLWESEVRFDE